LYDIKANSQSHERAGMILGRKSLECQINSKYR